MSKNMTFAFLEWPNERDRELAFSCFILGTKLIMAREREAELRQRLDERDKKIVKLESKVEYLTDKQEQTVCMNPKCREPQTHRVCCVCHERL